MSRFVQIHSLTSYPASLLNRDDAGFAKRIPFGGAVRTRISSQCLKKHWRSFQGEDGLPALAEATGLKMSVRSRFTFDEYVVKPLVEGEKLDRALVVAVTHAMMDAVLGKSAKAEKKRVDEEEEKKEEKKKGRSKGDGGATNEVAPVQTGQVTILGHPEVAYLRDLVRAVCATRPKPEEAADAVKAHLGRDGAKNLQSMRGAGLDAALFGRMVTSDLLAQGDAAVHVAHAFTVHAEATESDYFSAVDEILELRDDELGSGHIGTSELTTGLFYGYAAVDIPLLVSNVEGCGRKEWGKADRKLAAAVVERLVKMVATVSPGAKLGSTAPYACAHLVLVEAGDGQPRTLANAFLKPVEPRPDLVANTYVALARHAADLDAMYGVRVERAAAAIGPKEGLLDAMKIPKALPLAELASWAAGKVRG